MKEIKEDKKKKKKDISCSWIGGLNSVNITILLKTIHRFNAIHSKFPKEIFLEIEKAVLKFTQSCKISKVNKSVLRKDKARFITHFLQN